VSNIEQSILDEFKTIVQTHHKIGILVSGGIDSGLALFLLLKTITDGGMNREVHACTVTKTPDAVENATKVIGLISYKFNISVTHHIVDSQFDASEHIRHTASGAIFLFDITDIVITATNAIVPERLLNNMENPYRVGRTDPRVLRPFLEYTKDVTIGLAIKYELTELLVNSHSCIKQSYSRCGSCYWCKERAWGFSKNNYIDPGTN
jgi:7-cyano-7-deazaguanine synthase in queuosine biosynthesis